MSKIRSKNTKPELALRSALFKRGLRFRIHRKGMPGKPDIVFVGKRVAVFCPLLVRDQYPNQREMIAAHSSPVMVMLEGSQLLAAADAITILEQIEGALAYVDTIGTRPADVVYKRMRLVLTSAQREIHNRLHQAGVYHQ